jgi:hypothetical protein
MNWRSSYSRRRLVGRPDTPEVLRWRLANNKALAQVVEEMTEKYPVLTPENAREAARWQEARIKELTALYLEVK